MKKMILAGALAIVAASPALAATRHHRATDAYASVPVAQTTVVDNGQVLGADPDSFIRTSLIRAGSPANYNN